MKYLMVIISSIFLLLGCTEDGKDGLAYLSYSWTSDVYNWTDSNPSIPNSVYRNQDYQVSPGTYSCYYEWWYNSNSYYWYRFSYTISINPGEESSLFSDGDDGSDKYFSIYMGSTGPSLSGFRKIGGENIEDNVLIKQPPKDFSNYKKSEKYFEVQRQGQYTITLEYQRIFKDTAK